jgi:hypothetical protein
MPTEKATGTVSVQWKPQYIRLVLWITLPLVGFSSFRPWVHLRKRQMIAVWALSLPKLCCFWWARAQGMTLNGSIGGHRHDIRATDGPAMEILITAK